MQDSDKQPLFREQAIYGRQKIYDEYCPAFTTSESKSHLLLLLLCIVLLMILYCFGWVEFNDTKRVRGVMVTNEAVAKVAPSRYGIYENIFVENGQRVSKGTLLATVSITEYDSEGEDSSKSLFKLTNGNIQNLISQIEIAESAHSAISASIHSTIKSMSARISLLQKKARILEEKREIAKNSYHDTLSLVKKKYASPFELDQKELYLLEIEEQLTEMRARILSHKEEMDRHEYQLSIEQTGLNERLKKLNFEIAQLRASHLKAKNDQSFSLVSPINGVVTSLLPEGHATAIPGKPLLTLVPEGTQLVALLYIDQASRGAIEIGQEVKLFYDSFPPSEFSPHRAKVVSVDSKTVDPRSYLLADSSIVEPPFLAYAALESEVIHAGESGWEIPLQPDMQFDAEIILDNRTIFKRLVTPLKRFEERVL